ncbi:hypothetical protein EV356DRAFT_574184 [Viridothelium virens]|uniref:Ribosomal protein bL31m N-terminal domain-containing protein n=1 Tax=Viridothelium virens TaxID=1048519 RepID=A0A6A6HH15_VIRVR|nr:hypothetical protein EV356DRAFT_574184 [Viridothelium virens]
MSRHIPSATSSPLKRPISVSRSCKLVHHTQVRHATLLKRPKRPYTFTQLVTLSDGSTFIHRTTSPISVCKSAKDIRNSALWHPSSQKLLNVEEDEAGRLRAFRERFGRGWDAEAVAENEDVREGEEKVADRDESLLDLISGFGQEAEAQGQAKGVRKAAQKSGKGKMGEK